MIDKKNLENIETIVENETSSVEAMDIGMTDAELEVADSETENMKLTSEELLAEKEVPVEVEFNQANIEEVVPEVEGEIVNEIPVDQPIVETEKSDYDNLLEQFNQIYKAVADDKKGNGKGKGRNANTNPIVDIINQAVNGTNEMSKQGNKVGSVSVKSKNGGMSKGSGMAAGGKGGRIAKGGGPGKGMGSKGGGRGKSGNQDVVSSVVSGLTKSSGGGKGGGHAGGGKGGSSNLGVDIASTLIKGASKGSGKSSGLGIALSLLSKGMKKR